MDAAPFNERSHLNSGTEMSPFSRYLKTLRIKRGVRQKELAYRLGFEPSYLSALERSKKGPPRQDFIRRLVQGLALDESEQAELARALKASRRQVSLPAQASDAEYALLHQLEPQLGNLNPLQIQLITLALQVPNFLSVADAGISARTLVSPLSSKEAPRM